MKKIKWRFVENILTDDIVLPAILLDDRMLKINVSLETNCFIQILSKTLSQSEFLVLVV